MHIRLLALIYLRGHANMHWRGGDDFAVDVLAMPCRTDEAVASIPTSDESSAAAA